MLVALAGAHLDLVVHLGDERAHRVDDEAAGGARRLDDLGRGAVRRQHDRRARRHLGDVVDEHHAEVLEALDDQLVVDDLVVAVHGRLEGPHHPRQRLDRHLDAGAEAAGRGEQHPVDGHGPRLPARESLYPWPCPPLESSLSRPDRRPRAAGLAVGDEIVRHQRRGAARHHRVPVPDRRGRPRRSTSTRRPRAIGRRSRSAAGEPLGVEVHSALFDQVRTCDNHCEFCFIYQLPPGLRQSLYLKDDDYRLSFLYGNFTTLTRFTEADLERVVTERLSPLNVSIHATDPDVRADDAAQPARARRACAGCARCSTTASRCTARSWSAPASTTAPCSTTRSPASSTGTPSSRRCASCRSA